MSIKITGFDELHRKLTEMGQQASALDGEHTVSMDELFPATFMNACSSSSSFAHFLEAGGFVVESTEDFAAIPDDEWDAYVERSTTFANWEAMKGAAATAWMTRQLGLA